MSWSLQISHGDLTLSGSRLGTVTNEDKLVQDLRCVLLEPMGTDDLHVSYGSLLDGGRTPAGTIAPSLIGMVDFNHVSATVQSEIQRVAAGYQAQQLGRAKADRVTYNRVSLSPAEVLLNVTNIQMTQDNDTLTVVVTLQTGRGEDITLAIPLGNS